MVIRNRILALIYRLIGTIIGIVSLVFVFASDSPHAFSLNPMRFIGTEITMFSTIVLIIEAIITGISFRATQKKYFGIYGQVLYLAVGLEMALALSRPLSYLFINGGNINVPYFLADRLLTQIFIYIVFPIFVFFDWILFSEKGNWKYRWIIYLISIPLFYTVFAILNHYIRTSTTFATTIFDANTFLNYHILGECNGWVGVILSSLTIFGVYVLSGLTIVFLSYLFSGKYHRSTNS